MNDGSPTIWWHAALLDSTTLWCAAISLACAAAIVFLFAILRRLHHATPPTPGDSRPRGSALALNETGTVTMELALIAPFVMFLCLVLAQTTFLMSGNLFVHYAAFAATRSAIVQIPRDTPAEPANQFLEYDGDKWADIRAAAVFAVAPVSGESTQGTINADAVVTAFSTHYQNAGQPIPRWLESLVAARIRYADLNTDIRFRRTVELGDGSIRFDDPVTFGGYIACGPREVITIRVSHYFHLGVPVIWKIFADDDADGSERFTRIEAQYSLINEGVSEDMPPLPPDNQRRRNTL